MVAGLTAKSPLRDQQQQNISNNQQLGSAGKGGGVQGERPSSGRHDQIRIIGMIRK